MVASQREEGPAVVVVAATANNHGVANSDEGGRYAFRKKIFGNPKISIGEKIKLAKVDCCLENYAHRTIYCVG